MLYSLFLFGLLLHLSLQDVVIEEGTETRGKDRNGIDRDLKLKPLQILVIGGTQFMGRLLIDKLIEEDSTKKGKPKNLYNISMMNRGRTRNPFVDSKHKVHHLPCDRRSDREGCIRQLQEVTEDWDWMVDFSGFHPEQIDDLLKGLLRWDGSTSTYRLAVKRYVFISSDSVYMSTEAPKHDGFVLETDDKVAEGDHAKWLQARDDYQFMYGGLKRQCELTIMEPPNELNIRWPYTILRLPHVFGPYDNEGGWSRIQYAIAMGQPVRAGISTAHMRPRPFASLDWNRRHDKSDYRTLPFSVVYGPDVIEAIMAVLKSEPRVTMGQVYNIAGEDIVTLDDIFSIIGENLGLDAVVDENTRSPIPSTDFGPLNVRKALKALKWKPTPMEEWAPSLVDWYTDRHNLDYHTNIKNPAFNLDADSYLDADAAESGRRGKKKKSKSKNKGNRRRGKEKDEL
jgi:nucleoside-diphosphate-sugar epimerase